MLAIDDPSASRLEVLGDFALWVSPRRVELPFQAQRVLGLLAVDQPFQARATLAGRLWGECSQQRAQANLRNAMWRIRQASPGVLMYTRDAVGLATALTLDLDVARRCAEALLRDGSADAAPGVVELLDRDLLPAWDEDWLTIERERQRQLRIHALEALSLAYSRKGHHAEAIGAALFAVRAEPLRESAQTVLISAHLCEGNVVEAIRQLHIYRRLLEDELGIRPTSVLEAMVAQAVDPRR